MNYADKAEALFRQGNNCAQAVLGAFAGEYGVDEREALNLAASLGGGLGHGEMCGAVLGMLVAHGLGKAPNNAEPAAKMAHSAQVKAMVGEFAETFGATGCNELREIGSRDACIPYVRHAAEMTAQALGLEG